MAPASRKSHVLSNPFFVLLLILSTVFVITALGYLVSPYVLGAGKAPQGEWSRWIAGWLDRHSPMLLGVEFVAMLLVGILAMATDDWFNKDRSPP